MILEELATRFAWALIHSLWQGTIVALVAFILIGLVRGAAARHVIGMSAMTVILLLGISHLKQARPEMKEPVPGLVELAPVEALPTNGIAAPPVVVMEPVVNDPQRPAEVAIPEGSPLAPEQVIVEDASFQFLPWLSLVWLGGVLLLTLRHLGGWWLLRRWRMKGVNPVPEKIRIRALQIASRLKVTRDVPLLISDRVVVPLLVGVIKPVILLPVSLVGGIRPAELDALIAHELAHLRRRDGWANHLQIFIETLLFFHPAIWILGRLIRRERENAADDLALESGLDQRTYAGALASIAELGAQRGELALAANDGVLLSRIRRIVQADKARRVSPATGWLGSLALATTAMLCFSNPAASKSGEEKKVSETITVVAGESIQEALDKAKPNAVIQIGEGTFREAAIAEILKAVTSADPFLQLSGLTAFTASGDVRFDKASFHDPAVALLGSPDPAVRSQAAGAVVLAGLREGDLQKIEKLTHDKDDQVRIAGAQTLVWALKKDLTKEPFAKRIAALLENEATRKDILHSLWGATLSPEIEAAVLKLSNTTKVSEANTNDIAYTALYYSLSTQANKSEATVNRLVEYLAARDSHNIGGRAAWGLGQGVQPEQYNLVVKGALRFMTARTPQSYAFRQCLARVKQYAQKKNLPEIKKLLALPGVEGDLKKELEELVNRLGG